MLLGSDKHSAWTKSMCVNAARIQWLDFIGWYFDGWYAAVNKHHMVQAKHDGELVVGLYR